jgi:hypothetical protein
MNTKVESDSLYNKKVMADLRISSFKQFLELQFKN